MPQTPGQNGQSQMQDFPQGQMGNGFGGEFGGQCREAQEWAGRARGQTGAEEQGSAKEALYAGVSIVLSLLLSLRDVV